MKREVPLSDASLERLVNQGHTLIGGRSKTGSELETYTSQPALENAMSSLQDDEKVILWLRFWERYSFRQIQRELNHKSVSTTHQLYRRALAKLRTALDEDN